MIASGPNSPRRFEVGCTVSVSHTLENLSAHVELDGDLPIEPGDRIHVHGRTIHPPFGAVQIERRTATVTRAGFLRRLWIRVTGTLQCLSLLEVSFSDRRTL